MVRDAQIFYSANRVILFFFYILLTFTIIHHVPGTQVQRERERERERGWMLHRFLFLSFILLSHKRQILELWYKKRLSQLTCVVSRVDFFVFDKKKSLQLEFPHPSSPSLFLWTFVLSARMCLECIFQLTLNGGVKERVK